MSYLRENEQWAVQIRWGRDQKWLYLFGTYGLRREAIREFNKVYSKAGEWQRRRRRGLMRAVKVRLVEVKQ